MQISQRAQHTADTVTWKWENGVPETSYSYEFWIKFGDIHWGYQQVFSYSVFDETQSPMYNTGVEMGISLFGPVVQVSRGLQFTSSCFNDFQGCGIFDRIGWNHLTIVYNSSASTYTYYHEGTVVHTELMLGDLTQVPIIAGGMGIIGQAPVLYNEEYRRFLSGDFQLEEFRVWDYARTQEETIADLHVALPADTPGLSLYFNWDDTDGDDLVLQDMSGHGNHAAVGSIVNGKNVIAWEKGVAPSAPTMPRYRQSSAPVSGGLPMVVGVRPAPAVEVITLKGADPTGASLVFTISALPSPDVGTLRQYTDTSDGADIIAGGTEVTDGQFRVVLVLAEGVTQPPEGAEFRYTVTNDVGESAEGIVSLVEWIVEPAESMVMSTTEDSALIIPLSEMDDYGNTLTAVILVPPARGYLFQCGFLGGPFSPHAIYGALFVFDPTSLVPIFMPESVVYDGTGYSCVYYVPIPEDSEADGPYDSFTYALQTPDGLSRSESGTVTINVTPVNDAPVGPDIALDVAESSAYVERGDIEVSLSSVDPDATFSGGKHYYRIEHAPSFGKLLQVPSDGRTIAETAVIQDVGSDFKQWVTGVSSVTAQLFYGDNCDPNLCVLRETCPDSCEGQTSLNMIGPPDADGTHISTSHVIPLPCCSAYVVAEYDTPVFPTSFEIYESMAPNAISEVWTTTQYNGMMVEGATEWTLVYFREGGSIGPTPFVTPFTCPADDLVTHVKYVFDTSFNAPAMNAIDAMRMIGTLALGGGQLMGNKVVYRPTVGVHGVIDSFTYKVSDCITETETPSTVAITLPVPTDPVAALSWFTGATLVRVGGSGVVEVGVETLKLMLGGTVDLDTDLDVSIVYITGASATVYAFQDGDGGNATAVADTRVPLVVGDRIDSSSLFQLTFASEASDGPAVDVGVWVEVAGGGTYRMRLSATYSCLPGTTRTVEDGPCEVPQVTCSSDHWYYDVAACSSSLERAVTYHWNSEPRTCNVGSLPPDTTVECDMVPSESSTGTIFMIVALLNLIIALGFMAFLFKFADRPVVRYAQPKFCALYCVGAAVLGLSLLTFLGENSDWNCMLRPWVFNIGITLMFGPLFVKIRRVVGLFSNKKLKKIKITNTMLYKQMGYLLLVDVLVLVVWTAASPSTGVTKVRDEAGVGPVTYVTCESDITQFVTLMFVYKVGLVGYGSYLAWQSRNMDTRFSEAHHIFLAMYNIMFVGGVALLLSNALDVSVPSQLLIQGLGTGWSCIASLCLVFIPKVIRRDDRSKFGTSDGGNSNSTSTGTQGGTGGGDGVVEELGKKLSVASAENEKLRQDNEKLRAEIQSLKKGTDDDVVKVIPVVPVRK